MKCRAFSVLCLIAVVSGCEKSAQRSLPQPAKNDRPQIQAVSYPTAYFTERIGGHEVDVHLAAVKDGFTHDAWLDFQKALEKGDSICEELQRLKPDAIEQFALNFDLLKRDLLELDAKMNAVGKKRAGQPVVASHPVYEVWRQRYSINVKAVIWRPGEVPTDNQFTELKNILVSHPAKWFVWEREPAQASVEKLKVLGLGSVVFDPCSNVPEKGDWLDVMQANVKALESLQP